MARKYQALDEYLGQVGSTDVDALAPAARRAFWINAYNAMFLRAVSKWHPQTSIRRVPAIDRRVVIHVGEEPLTLAAIRERKILGAGDPRALFALRTGSASGPDERHPPSSPDRPGMARRPHSIRQDRGPAGSRGAGRSRQLSCK